MVVMMGDLTEWYAENPESQWYREDCVIYQCFHNVYLCTQKHGKACKWGYCSGRKMSYPP